MKEQPNPKRYKSGKNTSSMDQVSEATNALRIALCLKEDGHTESAWRWVEHAMDSALLAHPEKEKLRFDHETGIDRLVLRSDSEPPAALVISVGFATLGSLAHDDEDLDVARAAFEESLNVLVCQCTCQPKEEKTRAGMGTHTSFCS